MTIKKISYILTLVTCCLLVASCSDSAPDEPTPAPTGARASLSVKSRAGETLPDNELINTWWIAFADQSGVVRAIVKRDASLKTAVEREEFDVEIPAGTYIAYAFANITPDELTTEAEVTFTKGAAVDADVMSKIWKVMPNNWDKNKPVPMSGYKTVTISKQQPATPIAIEVVRMVGKVEFTFSNNSQKNITVNSVTFGPLATGAIPLFPDYAKLAEPGNPDKPGSRPTLLEGLGSESVSYDFAGDAAARTLAVGAKDALTDFFYVRESDVSGNQPYGKFHIAVNITREGQTEERLYALTEELSYINRNDYITIPITFTDYFFEVDILFYPPIGGYPAVETGDIDDVFYAKFGTRGKFVIRPLIHESGKYLQPSQYTLSVDEVSDPSGILTSTTFDVDPLTGELKGELKSNTGTATVKLSATVNQGRNVTYTNTKTIYIIRAN